MVWCGGEVCWGCDCVVWWKGLLVRCSGEVWGVGKKRMEWVGGVVFVWSGCVMWL